MPRQRILAYDALRVFAIVTVVAIHTLMPYRDLLGPTAPVRVLDDLLHYAVPLFVFISGVFAWGRPLPQEPGAYVTFLRRRGSVILLPYLAWSAVYLALLALQGTQQLTPVRVAGLLLSGHTWYHLYFIPMLLTFYLLTPLANRISGRSPELLVIVCYAIRILVGPEIANVFRTALGDLGWSYAIHIVTHLPHMALGAWFYARRNAIPRSWSLAIGLLALGTGILLAASLGWSADLPVLARRLFYPTGMAATVIGLALLALLLEPRLGRVEEPLMAASALAFGVYFVHPLFLLGVDEAVASVADPSIWLRPWFAVAVFAAVTAASFATSALLASRPRTCRLVGVTDYRQRTR